MAHSIFNHNMTGFDIKKWLSIFEQDPDFEDWGFFSF